jgi:uncharacterized protein (UPF0332 family)
MPFAEDLLEQANHLAQLEPVSPKQASLRRAISTAYYALFHLLIDEAVSHWTIGRQRSIIARVFDHDKMKKVCGEVAERAKSDNTVPRELNTVARAFHRLQQDRLTADYDNSKAWTRTDAEEVIAVARDAFQAWRAIANDDAAQDFLLNLFLPKPRQ